VYTHIIALANFPNSHDRVLGFRIGGGRGAEESNAASRWLNEGCVASRFQSGRSEQNIEVTTALSKLCSPVDCQLLVA
jgi:hypothetical protein